MYLNIFEVKKQPPACKRHPEAGAMIIIRPQSGIELHLKRDGGIDKAKTFAALKELSYTHGKQVRCAECRRDLMPLVSFIADTEVEG